MSDTRRARPTIRCLVEDLGIPLPEVSVDLGKIDDPWIAELRRVAPTSPTGQRRILSIAYPLVYRLRVSSERGATWVDDEDVVWLCAVRRREEGADDDAFVWFGELHSTGRLLPTDDDRLRERAEETVGLVRRLQLDLFHLVDEAVGNPSTEQAADLDGLLPCRAIAYTSQEVEEIWCAISVRLADGQFLKPEVRDILFALLEQHLAPAVFEARGDWPTGDVEWFEAVRLGMR
jgi:hypothetical protein